MTVSVHPTMTLLPSIFTKPKPFYTVCTDLGSGHATWFSSGVTRMYVASERLRAKARER